MAHIIHSIIIFPEPEKNLLNHNKQIIMLSKDQYSLLELFKNQKWDEARVESSRNQDVVRDVVSVIGFYEPKYETSVVPMHVACAHKPPPDVIDHLHDINPEGVATVDSTYKRLPLHIAVMNGASPKTISVLLRLYPEAARASDRLGRLPMHYACTDTIRGEHYTRYLMKAHPGSLTHADRNGFLPLHVACRSGVGMTTIRMLIRSNPTSILKKTKKGSTPIQCAKQAKCANKDLIVDILNQCLQETKKVALTQGYDTLKDDFFGSRRGSLGFGDVSESDDISFATNDPKLLMQGRKDSMNTLSVTECSSSSEATFPDLGIPQQ